MDAGALLAQLEDLAVEIRASGMDLEIRPRPSSAARFAGG
jgi:hypothetical protein